MELGHGGEAVVFGPFLVEELQSLFPKEELSILDPKEKYVVKIYKKFHKWTQNEKKILKKLHKVPFPNQIIIPLVLTTLPKQKIQKRFSSLLQENEDESLSQDVYKVEIQLYGGKDFFSFLTDSIRQRKPIPYPIFKNIWKSMQKILMNSYIWIVDEDLIITDIKPENMLIDPKGNVRLIDISAYPPDAFSRVITTDIQLLPSQYFNKQLKTSDNWEKRKNHFIQNSKRKYNSNLDHPWIKTLHQIHNNFLTFQQAFVFFSEQPFSKPDTIFFLVLYPIFLLTLKMIQINKISTASKEEEETVNEIETLCKRVLKNRGKVLTTQNTVKSMKQFLQEMSLSSVSKK